MAKKKKIFYLAGSHQSFAKAGKANANCLRLAGAEIVENAADADIVVLHDEPWVFPRHLMMNPDIYAKYIIAYAVWETDILPEFYRHNLDFADEIWTASSYCERIFRDHYENVHVIPHVTDTPVVSEATIEKLKRIMGYRSDEFYFYSIATAEDPRKNMPALLRALPRVVMGRRARYLIKTPRPIDIGPYLHTGQLVNLSFPMSDEMIHALHHIGNCYVSAHHSEGWGLCLSEAMAHGNLVVATGFSGNMDFMTEENSLPVKYSMAPAQMNMPWPTDGQWASIDNQDLVARLVTAVEQWDDLADMRERAKKDVARFSAAAVAELMRARLDAL